MKYTRAFTLIEMIVALAIFSVVAVVALGALIKIVSANKKAQSLQSAMSNINFALESMSREMRVGSNYHCESNALTPTTFAPAACLDQTAPANPTADNTPGHVISFRSSNASNQANANCNLVYAYRFVYKTATNSWDIEKAMQNDTTNDCSAGLGTFASIIDPSVVITGYYITVTNQTYPLAFLRISGYVGSREKEKTYFDVQTAVSARVPNGQ